MKKALIFTVALVTIPFLTGCGKETLTCTISKKQSGITMNQEVVAVFNNNEVTNIDMKINVKLDDAYKSYIDTYKTALESQYKTFTNNGGEVKIDKNKENGLDVKINLDLKKMTKEQKSKLQLSDTYGTKDATAKKLKEQGYTCK